MTVATPTLQRRLICLVYEAFLVTAVAMLGMFIFLLVTQRADHRVVEYGRQVVLFLVAGAYFVWCWTGSGHTLAMKTWRIKLVKVGYAKVPLRTAVIRYLLSWFWLLPAIIVSWRFHLTSMAHVSAAVAVGIIAWGMTAFLDKDRQFLHDKLAGTRLILLPKAEKAARKAA